MLIVNDYEAPNWFTAKGVALKIRKITKKGIPNLHNSRFLTLTLDRSNHLTPEQNYEKGSRHLRQFIHELRKKLSCFFGYAWKLEFHQDGNPHWHMILLYRKKIPVSLIKQCWRLGRTNVKRVTGQSFSYLFKYVTKSQDLPDWVLDYPRTIRFWQTSNFHTGEVESSHKKPAAEKSVRRPFYTLRTRIKRIHHQVIVTKTLESDPRRRYRILELNSPYDEFYEHFHQKTLKTGECFLATGFRVQIDNPKQLIPWIPKQKNLVTL